MARTRQIWICVLLLAEAKLCAAVHANRTSAEDVFMIVSGITSTEEFCLSGVNGTDMTRRV